MIWLLKDLIKSMLEGISNFEIEKVFKEISNEDINKHFLVLFSSGNLHKFVMFEKIMPGKKYPFIISNTERGNEGGLHWWSTLNISP